METTMRKIFPFLVIVSVLLCTSICAGGEEKEKLLIQILA